MVPNEKIYLLSFFFFKEKMGKKTVEIALYVKSLNNTIDAVITLAINVIWISG